MNTDKVWGKVGSILVISILVYSGLIVFNPLGATVNAASVWEHETDSDYENGTFDNVEIMGFGNETSLALECTYQWTKQNPPNTASPCFKNQLTMATIYSSDNVLLFGGSYNSAETWVYDLSANSWSEKTTSSKPTPRINHAMAGVSGTDSVVFFGGWDGSDRQDDTWIYDLSANTWTRRYPSNPPDPVNYHKMAPVFGTDNVILFGGYDGSDPMNETWVYDLSANTWTNKNPSGNTPSARYYHGLASIDGTDNVLLYGGADSYIFNDTWMYDLSTNTWTNQSPMNDLGPRIAHAMAPIDGDDKVMLFGGFNNNKHYNDTWVYDLSVNDWSKKTYTGQPMNRSQFALASLDGTDNVLLFGGNDRKRQFDDTWVYDLSADSWTFKVLPSPPYSRDSHALSSVFGDDKALLFGGFNSDLSGNMGDTWVYDLSDDVWTKEYPLNYPSNRRGPAMAGIYGTDKVLLFGGTSGSEETWIYDVSDKNWTNLALSTKPGLREYHAMASIYDADKVVLFGGWNGNNVLGDTWVYDLSENKWTNMNPTGNTPNDRCYTPMTYVYGDDKVILFGGEDSSKNNLDDTWVYDLSENTWSKKSQATKPSASNLHGLATIPNTKKFMMFGGYTTAQIDDTWIYDLRENSWTKITMTTKPVSRSALSVVPIDGTDNIMLFGGFDGTNIHDDTWVFGLSQYLTPGTYISDPFDTGTNSTFTSISWNVTIPSGTSVLFQIKTAATELGLSSASFVGPDGTTSMYYAASGMPIWSGHDGAQWVQYKVHFSTINLAETPRLENITISYNCWPETSLFSPESATTITNNKPTFVWNFTDSDSEAQSAFQVLISNDASFDNIIFDSDEQASNDQYWDFPEGTSYTELPDGTYYWKVRTKDSDGTWSLYSEAYVIVIDANAPSSETLTPCEKGCYNSIELMSGTAADTANGTGVNKVEIAIKRLTDNYYWAGSDWTPIETWLITSGTNQWTYSSTTILWTPAVTYNIRSRATDLASNIEPLGTGNNFTYDNYVPSSKINTPGMKAYSNKLETISGTASDTATAGVGSVEIKIIRTSDNSIWDGSVWRLEETWLKCNGTDEWIYDSSEVPWSTDIEYTIISRAWDNAGNTELPGVGNTFMFDNKAPEKLGITIDNGNEYTMTTSVILTNYAEDTGSGLAQMTFSVDGILWSEWEVFSIERLFMLMPVDGEKYIYFKVSDLAGNIAEPVNDSIILDTKPPESLSIIINENSDYTNSKIVTLSLTATDSLSGVKNMTFSNDGIEWSSWESFSTMKSLSLSPGDGEKSVFFKVEDYAGNTAEVAFDSIILDTTKPDSLTIKINNGAEFTNNELVQLDLTAFDSLSGVANMSFSTDEETWTSWEAFSSEKSFILPSANGETTVYFSVRDKAGNSAIVSNTISLDTEAPHSLSISINNGESKTDSRTVTLSMAALDDVSGVYQMSLSTDGINWSDWEFRSMTKSFELPKGNGAKTIYFRVIDNVGNIAEPVSASIELSEPSKDKSSKDTSDKGNYLMTSIFLIIVIVIIVCIAVLLIIYKKRHDQMQRERATFEKQPIPQFGPEPVGPGPGVAPVPGTVSEQSYIPQGQPPVEQIPQVYDGFQKPGPELSQEYMADSSQISTIAPEPQLPSAGPQPGWENQGAEAGMTDWPAQTGPEPSFPTELPADAYQRSPEPTQVFAPTTTVPGIIQGQDLLLPAHQTDQEPTIPETPMPGRFEAQIQTQEETMEMERSGLGEEPTIQERLDLLEKRLLVGDISEETYLMLKAKYEIE